MDTELTQLSHFQPMYMCNKRYQYTHELLQFDSCRPTAKVELPPIATAITTPLRVDRWQLALRGHPDQQFAEYIVRGISTGFRVGFNYKQATCKTAGKNMPSAHKNCDVVQEYLWEELRAGRVVGPIDEDHCSAIQTSSFGVIPKASQPGKWRLILDLSSPHGSSVNDGISKELASLQYTSVDQAVKRIISLGRDCLLAKIDVKQAYRNVPVHPQDRPLLGMRWRGQLLVDTVLPFGLRSAPKIFSALADALEWVCLERGVSWSIHYIDDFLTAGAPMTNECASNLSIFMATCQELGVPLKADKVEGPTSTITFLGLTLDTHLMEIRLPPEKIKQLVQLMPKWLMRRNAKKREVLSLIGKLAHATKVIPHGRAFLRRMIDTSCKARELDHWIHLPAAFHSDVAWWHLFLKKWNGRSMMDVHHPSQPPSVEFASDASGSWGCGAVWGNQWFQLAWHGRWRNEPIATKELLPVVVACTMWGEHWRHQKVLVHCDNLAVVHMICSFTSKDPIILYLLQCLHFVLARFDIALRAKHIPGVLNSIADAISRNHMQVLRRESPSLCQDPAKVPGPLLQLLVQQRPDWTSQAWKELLESSLETAWLPAHEKPMTQPKQHTFDSAETLERNHYLRQKNC